MSKNSLSLDVKNELAKFSLNIKLARKRRKFTLEDMSKRTGVSVATLVRLESGDNTVAVGTVMQVLDILGLLNGISKVIAPENDLQQVIDEVRNIRLKKNNFQKKKFNKEELNF